MVAVLVWVLIVVVLGKPPTAVGVSGLCEVLSGADYIPEQVTGRTAKAKQASPRLSKLFEFGSGSIIITPNMLHDDITKGKQQGPKESNQPEAILEEKEKDKTKEHHEAPAAKNEGHGDQTRQHNTSPHLRIQSEAKHSSPSHSTPQPNRPQSHASKRSTNRFSRLFGTSKSTVDPNKTSTTANTPGGEDKQGQTPAASLPPLPPSPPAWCCVRIHDAWLVHAAQEEPSHLWHRESRSSSGMGQGAARHIHERRWERERQHRHEHAREQNTW